MYMQRVLLVEDDPDIAGLVRFVLSGDDIAVEWTRNGAEALEWLRHFGMSPALILLDMRMPVMNGYDFARRYRAEHGTSPIVVMTAGEEAPDVAREVGAEGYIGKPFDIDVLAQVVKDHVR